ncbi:MAG: hypothetical protein IJ222_04065 [Bacteroidales bacterium]|nr:hypothetical protein [Bacteroidales bacterium]
MNRPLIWIASLFCCIAASAQEKVSTLFVDTRASFHQELSGGSYDSRLIGDQFNLHILGNISPTIDYRIRHSISKQQFDENNLFNGTDILYLNWQPNKHWSFLFGKYAVLIGGYEYDAAPIDVYFYSMFCGKIFQGFTFGGSASYHVNGNQTIVAQICNSPLSLGLSNIYSYNLAWNGHIRPWWRTIWSVNIVEDMDHQFINYIALGNHFSSGNTMLDLDVMNRGGIGQRRFFGGDMSFISKFIWSLGNWNICAKAGYEWNDARSIDSSGRAYDLVIAPGTEYFYGGCGLEWFPLGRDKIRLHAIYFRDSELHCDNFQLGITWKVRVI